MWDVQARPFVPRPAVRSLRALSCPVDTDWTFRGVKWLPSPLLTVLTGFSLSETLCEAPVPSACTQGLRFPHIIESGPVSLNALI